MTVRGIDVSAHQGEVDWRAVARSGIRFAFVRAFEGKDLDPTFERNRREALAAGLLVGSYSYLHARHPCTLAAFAGRGFDDDGAVEQILQRCDAGDSAALTMGWRAAVGAGFGGQGVLLASMAA